MPVVPVFPEARGYILYDPKKCTGCQSCMLACSLVHEGKTNLSLSRIQILEDRFGAYPSDILISACRQCRYPQCIEVCSVDAMYIDKDHMNVRIIDQEKCVGCKLCIKACYFEPSKCLWNTETEKAFKCDLCRDTSYWDQKGKLACVKVCPTRALKFSSEPPKVPGNDGYVVNLRGKGWKKLDLPVD